MKSVILLNFLVGSVDESGYIRRELSDIMDDLAFTQNVYTTEEKIEKCAQYCTSIRSCWCWRTKLTRMFKYSITVEKNKRQMLN